MVSCVRKIFFARQRNPFLVLSIVISPPVACDYGSARTGGCSFEAQRRIAASDEPRHVIRLAPQIRRCFRIALTAGFLTVSLIPAIVSSTPEIFIAT
jgi:hypothetical protein